MKLKQHSIVIITLILIVFFDLFTKHLVESNMDLRQTIDVFGSFIQLVLIYNKGGVFGIGQGQITFFLIVSVFVLFFIFYTYYTFPEKTKTFQFAIGLVLGGAFGNMHDRIFNENGVVDFIYMGWDEYANVFGYKIFLRWPAYNVADAAIVVGAILLAFFLWKQEKRMQNESAIQGKSE